MKTREMPFISIIIPVYNDSKRLGLCLKALHSQSYPQKYFEVLIVDNGSEDDLEEIVKEYNVILLRENRPGSYRARNCGIKHSKGEIIGFTDSDCIPDSDWIEVAARHFQRKSNCFVLSGKINVIRNNKRKKIPLLLYDQIYHFNQERFSKKKNFAATANLFCRRKVFELVGFFNDEFYSFGDVEFGERVETKGLRIDYNEKLKIDHPQIENYKALWDRSKRLAGGGRQLRAKKGYSRHFEFFYILLLVMGTPLVIIDRFMYKGISCISHRVLFAWTSLIVHLSKCLELTRLLFNKKKPVRK